MTRILPRKELHSEQIRQVTNENLSHRLRTQPYKDQSCGSVFRNPQPLKAAKLIEDTVKKKNYIYVLTSYVHI